MKHFICLLTAFFFSICIYTDSASAQAGRRRISEDSVSAETTVLLPVPDPAQQTQSTATTTSTEEGQVYECVYQEQSTGTTSSANKKEEAVFSASEVTSKAVIHEKPTPTYMEDARWNGTSGRVVLQLVLSASGKVTFVTVLKGLTDGLSKSAVEAACRVVFTPAQKDGRDVAQRIRLEYAFRLYDDPFFDPPLRVVRPRVPRPYPLP